MAKLTAVPSNPSQSAAPKHLKPATRAWFDQIVSDFELESQHMRILQLAAESVGRLRKLARCNRRAWIYFRDKRHGDIKPRPEVAIMQNSRIALLRALRELNLDVAPPDSPRPKPLKYSR